jgi:hypothetical protein
VTLGGTRGRYGLTAVVVTGVALLAGVAVAGLPETVPDDVRVSDIRPPAPPSVPQPTTAPDEPRAVAEIRGVVADAGAGAGPGSAVAADLRRLGYLDVVATDASVRRATSVVYHAPGLDRAGEEIAAALGVPAVEPRPSERIVVSDAPADVWILLGDDRLADG